MSSTSTSSLPTALGEGTAFGRYRIASRLATGGMASVWLARLSGAEGFEKEVVIKTMLPELASSPELVRMFINEATIAARFNHPNIVQVFDFGCMAGHHYIVMEYVAGRSLRQIRRRLRAVGKQFPPRLLLRAIVDICRALRYAHELPDGSGSSGFIHGDISPENIMVSRGGTTKLIDFGAAHIDALPRPTGKFIGKYRYVSPERLGGGVGDRRSDIYSLGVILYEFLTGVRPFEGDNREIVAQVRRGRPRDPREIVPALHPDLVAIILKAMAAYPEDRYPTTEYLAVDLMRVLRERLATPPQGTEVPREEAKAEAVVDAPAANGNGHGDEAMPSVEIEIIDDSEPIEAAEKAHTPPLSVFFNRRPPQSADDSSSDGFSFGLSGSPPRTSSVRWLPVVEPRTSEASRHFDRGFVLAVAKRYQEALEEWELALAADPGNHMYQTNVLRLREHCRAQRA
jgi:serine/threonine protein kinase